jgi:hypothetical protein
MKNEEWQMNVMPSSPGETRMGFFDSPVIGRKADSPTNVPSDCILRRTALLRWTLVFIAYPNFIIDSSGRLGDAISAARVLRYLY